MTTPTTTLTLIIDGLTYLHGNTLEDLRQQLLSRAAALTALADSSLGDPIGAALSHKADNEAREALQSARKAKAKAKADKEPEVEQAAAPEPEEPVVGDAEQPSAASPPSATDADTDPVTYEDVRAAVTRLAALKGRDAALAVLDTFGVDHGSKLTEDQWAPALAALAAAAAEEDIA